MPCAVQHTQLKLSCGPGLPAATLAFLPCCLRQRAIYSLHASLACWSFSQCTYFPRLGAAALLSSLVGGGKLVVASHLFTSVSMYIHSHVLGYPVCHARRGMLVSLVWHMRVEAVMHVAACSSVLTHFLLGIPSATTSIAQCLSSFRGSFCAVLSAATFFLRGASRRAAARSARSCQQPRSSCAVLMCVCVYLRVSACVVSRMVSYIFSHVECLVFLSLCPLVFVSSSVSLSLSSLFSCFCFSGSVFLLCSFCLVSIFAAHSHSP